MAKLATILDQMADAIADALSGVDVDVQVEPRMVWNPTPPCVDIWPADPSTDEELAGFDDDGAKLISVRARVGTADHEAGQDLLLALMDPEDDLSIRVALEDDQTLNGYASSVFVRDQSGYQMFPTADNTGAYLGCQWTVLVIDIPS